MFDFFEELSNAGAHRILAVQDKPSGLRAFIALDDMTLGPACGGVRTLAYGSTSEALKDAGIKGVKYADAQTRFSPKGKTHNYVIFDDKLIQRFFQFTIFQTG